MAKIKYILAGAAVYLIFMLFQALDLGAALTLVSVPVCLWMLLTVMGFFDMDLEKDLSLAKIIQSVQETRTDMTQPETGGGDGGRQ